MTKMVASRSVLGRGMSSNLRGDAISWNRLWAIKAPGKMLITIWRFAHDCLPTGMQLQQRHIPASKVCLRSSIDEHVEHALLFCPYAQAVWNDVKHYFNLHLGRQGFTSCKRWIFDFLARCDDLAATVRAVTCWHIWDARNKLHEENITQHPSSVALKIKACVNMIVEHLFISSTNHRREPSPTTSWVPPPVGRVMINVDAALFSHDRSMGAGVVMRDHSGSCITCYGTGVPNVILPELAEAIAIQRGLLFSLGEGFQKVILGSDCLTVIQRINSLSQDRSLCGPVIQDIKQLRGSFMSCSIFHVRREQNVAAHLLARSCNQLECHVWRGVSPECIRETICMDIMP
uniref:RNase H type-1 domain-containing protein n=1 Tax=Hordeum vulgare subsp. vulgare TaxID=112509 RepID=A0A8I6Z480_HORVV